MHTYELEGREKVFVVAVGVSVLLVWLLHIGLGAVDFNPQWWLSVPSFAGCYSGFLWLFDRYQWKFGLLRNLKLVSLPDLNGRWIGEVKSSCNSDGSGHKVSAVVLQRWSKMVIRLETEQSRSSSIVASLRTTDLTKPELSYQYVNEPRSDAPGTMAMHRGTATLELDGSRLEGDYYTGRGRGEIGTITLSRCYE
ncbi:MAG: hypothetical protein F4Y63_04950 [Chloroflexi bacterium]|nr:hypothetical protein [Chloroflexota bacterium]MYF79139.1 hypothetical protein [Chloroflexota bacterium]MYK60993.1 hypothetical protein [Chloroflexota bacterium]